MQKKEDVQKVNQLLRILIVCKYSLKGLYILAQGEALGIGK